MLRKIRYHHCQSKWWKTAYKGYSIMMIPVDQEYVELRHTFCSQQDQFCKRQAREELQHKEGAIIPVSLLPQAVAEISSQMWNGVRIGTGVHGENADMFAWLWKYFL
jgi:hypothetical protein